MALSISDSGSQAEKTRSAALRQDGALPTSNDGQAGPPDLGLRRSASEIQHLRYARKLLVSDALIICGAVAVAAVIRVAGGAHTGGFPWTTSTAVGYTVVSVVLASLWMVFLALGGSRSRRVVGRGIEEYANIALSTFQLFGLIAIVALLLQIEISRGYLGIALPLGMVGLMCGRKYWRSVADNRRSRGDDRTSVLVVGDRAAAREMAATFAREPEAGYWVAGICTPAGPTKGQETISVGGRDIPVVGVDEAIVDAVRRTGVTTVAITATGQVHSTEVRRLIWELDPLGVDLVVAPGLVDIADHRLHTRAIGGMAVLEVSKPQYNRANSLAKRAFDLVFATVALIVAAPLMILAAVGVMLSGPGPVFYTSERIGLNGATFKMIKFRSMRPGADQHVGQLIEASGDENPLFFKVKDDPRVTPFGRIMRKFSIDELPQFFNVLRGEMSVVGPRPQVRREVDSYDDLFRRRLAVKPGLTGLWQVSGRSDLRIEDAVRLDLTYVENWSAIQDLMIIAKTIKTVLRSHGAY